jgi:mono/diheme cytochrome c family protein
MTLLQVCVRGAVLAGLVSTPTRAADNDPAGTVADAAAGRQVYEATCARCHGPTPIQFSTEPDALGEFLQSGSVRSHRFSLSETEIEALVRYVTEVTEKD